MAVTGISSDGRSLVVDVQEMPCEPVDVASVDQGPAAVVLHLHITDLSYLSRNGLVCPTGEQTKPLPITLDAPLAGRAITVVRSVTH